MPSSDLALIAPACPPRSATGPASPKLLGVDVRFSETAKSTGMAWRVDGRIGACRTGFTWETRCAALPAEVTFDLAALDAPLVPAGPGVPRRGCEAVNTRAPSQSDAVPG